MVLACLDISKSTRGIANEPRGKADVQTARLCLHISLDHIHRIPKVLILGQPLPIIHAQNIHALVIVQVWEQLGRDEEVLRAFWPACNLYHRTVY